MNITEAQDNKVSQEHGSLTFNNEPRRSTSLPELIVSNTTVLSSILSSHTLQLNDRCYSHGFIVQLSSVSDWRQVLSFIIWQGIYWK